MMRKNEKMYKLFGKAPGEKCKTCDHLKDGKRRKCRCYGVSASEATDWTLSWDACGLYNVPFPYDMPVYKWEQEKEPEEQMPGQLSLF